MAALTGCGGASPQKLSGKLVIEGSEPRDEFNVGHVYVAGIDGSSLRRVVRPAASYPSWSPDGRRLAFNRVLSDGTSCFYVASSDGGHPRCVAHGNWQARWSPDGTKLAYQTPYFLDISVAEVGGKHRERRLRLGRKASDPDWSPDGDAIVFIGDVVGSGPLYVYERKTRRVRLLVKSAGAYNPRWSADGNAIYFMESGGRARPDGFYSVNRDGTRRREVRAAPRPSNLKLRSVNWSWDGRSVVYCDPADDLVSLQLVPHAIPHYIPLPFSCESVDLDDRQQ